MYIKLFACSPTQISNGSYILGDVIKDSLTWALSSRYRGYSPLFKPRWHTAYKYQICMGQDTIIFFNHLNVHVIQWSCSPIEMCDNSLLDMLTHPKNLITVISMAEYLVHIMLSLADWVAYQFSTIAPWQIVILLSSEKALYKAMHYV